MSVPASKLRRLPSVRVPQVYELRGYRPGDEESWVALLGLADFDGWTRGRLEEYLADEERRQGSRVVCKGRTVVAGVFASRQGTLGSTGLLDFVASHPEHRGKGLGRATCVQVLRYFVERGDHSVVLTTDDRRLPALGLYLSLGFTPVMTGEDMPRRWKAVMEQLGRRSDGPPTTAISRRSNRDGGGR